MATIYLVRHGENEANVRNVFSHRIVDFDLTHRGREQATQAAGYLAGKGIGDGPIFSSPLKRAVQTAELLARRLGREIEVIEEFRELDVGAFDGAPIDDHLPAWWTIIRAWSEGRSDTRFPGGESHAELSRRVRSGIERILATGHSGPHVVVAHAGLLRIGFAGLTQKVPDCGSSIPNCSISTLEIDPDGAMSFSAFAQCDFLTDPTGTWRH